MKEKWTEGQLSYINFMGRVPTKTEEILTMNYCVEWCKAYGKSINDWMNGGFNNHMYSKVKDPRKAKVLRHQMELLA